MKNGSKLIKKIILIFLISVLISNFNFVYANDEADGSTDDLEKCEVSEEFKKWLELPDEERENTIQPQIYSLSLKDSIKRSRYNALLSAGSSDSLESKYDTRNILESINVKNQQKTGDCWNFTYSSMAEITMAKLHNKYTEYSPTYIDYQASRIFNTKIGKGGNILIANTIFANRLSPVLESDFPFSSYYDETNNSEDLGYLKDISQVDLNQKVVAKLYESVKYSNINKIYNDGSIKYCDDDGNELSETEVNAIRTQIKQHVKKYGAVSTAFYAESNFIKGNDSDYFNSNKNAYYYYLANGKTNSDSGNHTLVIVGWDDNYSKDNFNSKNKPIHDGAYICLSSWGKSFGDNGFFYVSYDDQCIEYDIFGIKNIEDTEKKSDPSSLNKIETSYIYDELGLTGKLKTDNDSIYGANVFNRQIRDGYNEYLTEIGLYISNTVGVKIYYSDNDDKTNKTLLAEYTGSNALEAGYHLITLDNKVQLTKDKFSIIVQYINTEGIDLPVESNPQDLGTANGKETVFDTAKSNEGESFFSVDGNKWEDLYTKKLTDGTALKNTNFCIRAFTESEPVTSDEHKNETTNNTTTNMNVTNNTTNTNIGLNNTSNVTKNTNSGSNNSSNTIKNTNSGSSNTLNITKNTNSGSSNTSNITKNTNSGSSNLSNTIRNTVAIPVNRISNTSTNYTKNGTLGNTNGNTVKKDPVKETDPDDIYRIKDNKDNNTSANGVQQIKVNSSIDNSTSKLIIPYTGTGKLIAISVIIIAISGVVFFIKYRNYRDL